MLAVRYYGIRDVRIEVLPRPVCGPKEVLVKVAYAGICGSDLHIYRKGMFVSTVPETMGHEFSGVVEEVGPGVTGFNPGSLAGAARGAGRVKKTSARSLVLLEKSARVVLPNTLF
jgi:threonine dehydrogenase-like Zn-dependent dehydrogenase